MKKLIINIIKKIVKEYKYLISFFPQNKSKRKLKYHFGKYYLNKEEYENKKRKIMKEIEKYRN